MPDYKLDIDDLNRVLSQPKYANAMSVANNARSAAEAADTEAKAAKTAADAAKAKAESSGTEIQAAKTSADNAKAAADSAAAAAISAKAAADAVALLPRIGAVGIGSITVPTISLGNAVDVTVQFGTTMPNTTYRVEFIQSPALIGMATFTVKSRTTTSVVVTVKATGLAIGLGNSVHVLALS